MQIHTQQTAEGKIVVLDLVIGFVEVAVRLLNDGHCVLGHRIGRVGGHPEHGDAVLSGGLQIHIVEAGAPQQDQPDIHPVQLLNHRAGGVVVDENAHGIAAVCQNGGFRSQVGGDIGQLGIVSTLALIPGQFREEDPVVILGAEKGDPEQLGLPVLLEFPGEDALQSGGTGFLVCAVHSDGEGIAFAESQTQQLQHIAAIGGAAVAGGGDKTFESDAGLRQQSAGAGVGPQFIGDKIVDNLHVFPFCGAFPPEACSLSFLFII